ncbi:hypothetical protein [Citrobacter braakii]|uniref:hypothetical protein n=1 Tax=Citrobacter braakii TaxID=57706 RepID=UPI003976A5D0
MFRYLSLLAVMLSGPSFASIELHMSGRDIDECQYLYAYDDASLEDNLEEIMAGNLTPVRFEVRVIYTATSWN